MSLETSVAAQTATIQDLIDNFSAKKAEIDTAVSNAIAAVPSMSRNFYVDAINGNDANAGSSTAPFQTIKKACDSVPIGGRGVIRIQCDQTHIIDVAVTIGSKNIEIVRNGVTAVPVVHIKANISLRQSTFLTQGPGVIWIDTLQAFGLAGSTLTLGQYYTWDIVMKNTTGERRIATSDYNLLAGLNLLNLHRVNVSVESTTYPAILASTNQTQVTLLNRWSSIFDAHVTTTNGIETTLSTRTSLIS